MVQLRSPRLLLIAMHHEQLLGQALVLQRRVDVEVAEAFAKGALLVVGDVLVAEDDDAAFGEEELEVLDVL